MTKMQRVRREELPADHRIVRHYGKPAWIEYRASTKDETEYRYVVEGRRPCRFTWERNPCTHLNTCEVCGVIGVPRKVARRTDVYGWDWETPYDYKATKDVLCVRCWNRARAVKTRRNDVEQNRLLINRIKREICNVRKQREQDG